MNPPNYLPSRVKFFILIFVVLTWVPWQPVVYLLPFLLYFLLLFKFSLGSDNRYILKSTLYGVVFISILFVLSMLGLFHGSSLVAPLIWLLTHSYVVLIFILPFLFREYRRYASSLLIFYIHVNIAVGLVEALVGAGQFFVGPSFADTAAAGDFVIGTLGNNSHLYAMKMLFLSIICGFMYQSSKKKYYLLSLLVFLQAWLLGSALHTILVIAMGYGMYTFLNAQSMWRVIKQVFLFVALGSVTLGSLFLFQENNVRYLENKLSFENTAAPIVILFGKVALFDRTLFKIPQKEPLSVFALGFGPGAYSSRASWMISGHYLSRQSFVPVAPSYAWNEYLSDLWDTDLLKRYKWMQGVANQPFSTWMSVLGEFGWLGILLLFYLVIGLVLQLRKQAKYNMMARCSLFLVCFTLASFFFDNWDEYPRYFFSIIVFVFFSMKVVTSVPLKELHSKQYQRLSV